ncbi:MAG: DUF4349 domain-containing protein [Ruminococcaceae bacterium]|nr:DUF4349 domain-containing protein [Oscillospiraceae bacterium]
MKQMPLNKKAAVRYGLALLCLLLSLVCLLVSCKSKSADIEATDEIPMLQNGASGSSSPGASPDATDKSEIGEAMGGASEDGADAEYTTQESKEYEVKIIRTANVSAETKSFDSAVTEIESEVEALGGYMESSEITGRNYASQNNSHATRSAKFSIRVPAEDLDAFLGKAGELLNVTSSATTATDVSNDYYDIEARLNVLRTEREVLEKMLAESTNISNMITVEQRLYDVIYEIESYETMLRVYDSKVAYSTVTLELWEVSDLTLVVEENTFGARFKKAIGESWRNFVDFCKDAVIWFVYALPALVILGVIATVVSVVTVWIVRKRRKGKDKESL